MLNQTAHTKTSSAIWDVLRYSHCPHSLLHAQWYICSSYMMTQIFHNIPKDYRYLYLVNWIEPHRAINLTLKQMSGDWTVEPLSRAHYLNWTWLSFHCQEKSHITLPVISSNTHDIYIGLAHLTQLNIQIFACRKLYLGTSNCKLCSALYNT